MSGSYDRDYVSEADIEEVQLEVDQRKVELDMLKGKLEEFQDEYQQLENSVDGSDISDSTKMKARKIMHRFTMAQNNFEANVYDLILLEAVRLLKVKFNSKCTTSVKDLPLVEAQQIKDMTIDQIKEIHPIEEYQSVLNGELDSDKIDMYLETETDIEHSIIDSDEINDDPAIGTEAHISQTVDSALELFD